MLRKWSGIAQTFGTAHRERTERDAAVTQS
jgi:hypothetical protein